MFEQLTDRFLHLIEAFPALLTERGSPQFHLARAMIALLVIALAVYILTFLPYRRVGTWIRKKLLW
jgi:hypothetical protein